MDIKEDDILKGVLTFIVGIVTANAGKIMDWLRGASKDKAETGKITTEMLLSMLKSTKELNDALTGYNDKIVKENYQLSEDKRTLAEKLFDSDQARHKCEQDKMEFERRFELEKKRNAPDNRGSSRNQGGP